MGRASLVAQMVKSLPAVWETRDRSLGWEDALGKEMATHSSVLAWKIPWMEEPGGLWKILASGLTEFIPFIGTTAIWGQILFLDCLHLIPCPP